MLFILQNKVSPTLPLGEYQISQAIMLRVAISQGFLGFILVPEGVRGVSKRGFICSPGFDASRSSRHASRRLNLV